MWRLQNDELYYDVTPQQHKNSQRSNSVWQQTLPNPSFTTPPCYLLQCCQRQQFSQVCKIVCESFIQLLSITAKLQKL
jgi:hypothetical protein